MYAGPWVFMHKPPETNTRADKDMPPVTLIHDDAAARALGFKGGFVGGQTLLGLASTCIAASFGHLWYEGGTISVRNRAPVYEGEMRVLWEEARPGPGEARRITFHLETRDTEPSTPGWAALPSPGASPVPPWESAPVRRAAAAPGALPELKVGMTRQPFEAVVTLAAAVKDLDVMRDYNWWHRYASPWGPPILNPYQVCHALYQGFPQSPANPLRSPRLRTSMDAGTDLVVYAPFFADNRFTMKASLADKWQTERTVFFVTEYRYEDEAGKLLAVMQAVSAHLIRDLAPA